jgi:cell division transport system permease protein
LYWIGNTFPEVSLFHDLKLMLIVIGLLILLGVGIYLLSTYYVVNKYLRMRMDDLY